MKFLSTIGYGSCIRRALIKYFALANDINNFAFIFAEYVATDTAHFRAFGKTIQQTSNQYW